MIIIKIELHSAISKKVTTIGKAVISNEGISVDGKKRDYHVGVVRKNHVMKPVFSTKFLREGKVYGHNALGENIWRLVIKGLLECFPEDKK